MLQSATEVVIVDAVRTAVGKFGGALADIPASDLGAHVIKHLLQRTGIASAMIDEVIMGHVITAGCGQNPARQAALAAGLPEQVPAFTVNKVCGSGLKAVHLGMQSILNGDARIVIAGGQENMSLAPHLLAYARKGWRIGNGELTDAMLRDGLVDAFGHFHMGVTAENVARHHGISRDEQDSFALASQRKAEQAQLNGWFTDEIVPVESTREAPFFSSDEYVRHGTSKESLVALRPAFAADGTVTAGNASGINDGAAAVVLMSAELAQELGLPVLARIRAFASAGVEPAMMGMGPVPAIQRCLARIGWRHEDLDLIELNEAFAAQAIAVNREMGWATDKINVNGGAIAIGHPIGASGCRILVTLLHAMKRRNVTRGLASLCIGGGMGVAMAVERS